MPFSIMGSPVTVGEYRRVTGGPYPTDQSVVFILDKYLLISDRGRDPAVMKDPGEVRALATFLALCADRMEAAG